MYRTPGRAWGYYARYDEYTRRAASLSEGSCCGRRSYMWDTAQRVSRKYSKAQRRIHTLSNLDHCLVVKARLVAVLIVGAAAEDVALPRRHRLMLPQKVLELRRSPGALLKRVDGPACTVLRREVGRVLGATAGHARPFATAADDDAWGVAFPAGGGPVVGERTQQLDGRDGRDNDAPLVGVEGVPVSERRRLRVYDWMRAHSAGRSCLCCGTFLARQTYGSAGGLVPWIRVDKGGWSATV